MAHWPHTGRRPHSPCTVLWALAALTPLYTSQLFTLILAGRTLVARDLVDLSRDLEVGRAAAGAKSAWRAKHDVSVCRRGTSALPLCTSGSGRQTCTHIGIGAASLGTSGGGVAPRQGSTGGGGWLLGPRYLLAPPCTHPGTTPHTGTHRWHRSAVVNVRARGALGLCSTGEGSALGVHPGSTGWGVAPRYNPGSTGWGWLPGST